MFKNVVLIICLSFAISACSLNNAKSVSPIDLTNTPQTLISSNSVTEEVVAPTSTPIPVIQNSKPITVPIVQNNEPSTSSTCTIPNPSLPIYRVVSRDTLSSIAVRTNTTVAELVRLNCLGDTNLIAVGQQLYIPNAIPTTNQNSPAQNNTNPQSPKVEEKDTDSQTNQSNNSQAIDLSKIPQYPATYHGSIIPSSWLANHEHIYILEENTTVRLTWSWFPDNLGITLVGFVIKPNNKIGGYTLVGTDTNSIDGASTQWTVPTNAQFDIFAVGLIDGQQELIVSESIRVGARNSSQPLQPRTYGTVSVSPTIETVNITQVVVDPDNIPTTISWLGPKAFGYHLIGDASFYYRDENGTSLLGVDKDDSDGISITFTTHPNLSGVIYAEGDFVLFSTEVFHVTLKMQDIQIESNIEGCQLYAFGIGAPHPVYTTADVSSIVITEIQAMNTYSVIEKSGEFYHIELGEQSGWVDSYRGQLIGDCNF